MTADLEPKIVIINLEMLKPQKKAQTGNLYGIYI